MGIPALPALFCPPRPDEPEPVPPPTVPLPPAPLAPALPSCVFESGAHATERTSANPSPPHRSMVVSIAQSTSIIPIFAS
jgi:hypothetical protein